MNAKEFRELLRQIEALPPSQRAEVQRLLSGEGAASALEALLSPAEVPPCPHCRGASAVRWGRQRGLPRFRCESCRRLFDPLTGTPLSGLRHRDRWLAHLEALLEGKTLAKTAQACGIHINTAHRWRKRFLALLERVPAETLSGVVEADETFVLDSCKGRPADRRLRGRPARRRGGTAKRRGRSQEQIHVIVARDRAGHTRASVWPRLSRGVLQKVLSPVLDPDSVLVSDGAASYEAYARREGLHHEALNVSAGERKRGIFHLQNVNGYHSRLKRFLARFNGVSTAHLHRYVRWFHLVERAPSPQALLGQTLGLA
jgi:transposase-like protein